MKTSITSGQEKQLVRVVADATESAIETLRLTKDEAQSMLGRGDVIKGVILEEMRKLSKVACYPITIDYGESIEEMIASGCYDRRNGDITSKNFPTAGAGTVQVNTALIHMDKHVHYEVVLAHLEANGLRPATLAELLAFGATYPEIQRQFRVIALGSSWVGAYRNRFFPFIGRYGRGRVLRLCYGDNQSFCRFLAVRK